MHLNFTPHKRLDIRRIQAIKAGDEVIGNRTRVKVVKNKVASPLPNANLTFFTVKESPEKLPSLTSESSLKLSTKVAHGSPTMGNALAKGVKIVANF